MNDDQLIMTTSLSYLIVNFILHLTFFAATIFNHKWQIVKRYFKRTVSDDSSCSNIDKLLSSDYILETETILNRTIRSFTFLLCTCLLITNWFRLGIIYFLPTFYPNLIQSSLNFCTIQSFFLHILTLFHLHLMICLPLFWHYCFTFEKYWLAITYRRILAFLLFVFICLCLFTLPSISNEWASITFDQILRICIVNYAFNYSYTFFVLIFTCVIPFILLIISHRRQMKTIKNRIVKYLSIDQRLNISREITRFRYSSYLILIWSVFNILLLICLHTPIKHLQTRTIVYYIQLISFLIDPIIYIFIFRSLTIISLLRPSNGIYFI